MHAPLVSCDATTPLRLIEYGGGFGWRAHLSSIGTSEPTAQRATTLDCVSERDWRDEPLLPDQTEDDIDRESSEDENDRRLREDVPPHHGD